MDPNTMQVNPVNILTTYQPEAMTSALAFMQSFYPPIPVQEETDPSDMLANNTLAPYPGGAQYPLVDTFTPNDPYGIFISGADNCLNGDVARNQYLGSRLAQVTYNQTEDLYMEIGTNFLPARMEIENMNYFSAWEMYDAIDYLNRHDTFTQEQFGRGGQFEGDLSWMADLASEKMWNYYGVYNATASIEDNVQTTAGSTLAGAVYMYFNQMLESGGELQKFNLIVADFAPIISMLAIMANGQVAYDYRQLPAYATSIVFELFSYDHPDTVNTMPDPSTMFVRFYFRNGTAPGTPNPNFWALPMFGYGPSHVDMSWEMFSSAIQTVAFTNPMDWCSACDAYTVNAWCQGYLTWAQGATDGSSGSSNKKTVTPAEAGVIGAFVTLALAGMITALGFFLCGFRIHKRQGSTKAEQWYGNVRSRKQSSLGGYKGSAKMASDADLHIPPNAAPMGGAGAEIIRDKNPKDLEDGYAKRPGRGHERVGSWELNNTKDVDAFGHSRFASVGSTIIGAAPMRSSFDDDFHHDHDLDHDHDHDADEIMGPVQPRVSF
jgi:hypothetical protein